MFSNKWRLLTLMFFSIALSGCGLRSCGSSDDSTNAESSESSEASEDAETSEESTVPEDSKDSESSESSDDSDDSEESGDTESSETSKNDSTRASRAQEALEELKEWGDMAYFQEQLLELPVNVAARGAGESVTILVAPRLFVDLHGTIVTSPIISIDGKTLSVAPYMPELWSGEEGSTVVWGQIF